MQKTEAEQDIQMTKRTILVIESNTTARPDYDEVFRGHETDWDVQFAPTAGSAEFLLGRKKVDVILLGSTGCGTNALEFLRALRSSKTTTNTAVIYVSAQEDIDEEYRVTRAGADLYQYRACHPKLLRAQIEQLLERRRFRLPFLGFQTVQISLTTGEAIGALAAAALIVRVITTVVR